MHGESRAICENTSRKRPKPYTPDAMPKPKRLCPSLNAGSEALDSYDDDDGPSSPKWQDPDHKDREIVSACFAKCLVTTLRRAPNPRLLAFGTSTDSASRSAPWPPAPIAFGGYFADTILFAAQAITTSLAPAATFDTQTAFGIRGTVLLLVCPSYLQELLYRTNEVTALLIL